MVISLVLFYKRDTLRTPLYPTEVFLEATLNYGSIFVAIFTFDLNIPFDKNSLKKEFMTNLTSVFSVVCIHTLI